MPITHRYSVSYDTSLGRQIASYIERCVSADAASRDFAFYRAHAYGLSCVTADTELVYSDDCDAGGLIGFSLPASQYADIASDMRISVLWDFVDDDNHTGHVIVFPRAERHTHFIRHKRALELYNEKAEDWEFDLCTPKKFPDCKQPTVYQYGQVHRFVLPEDLSALVRKAGTRPAESTRLARGRQVVLNTQTLPQFMHVAISTYRSEAFQLLRELTALPCVPAHTLMHILRLRADDSQQLREGCFCRWHDDRANRRYLITTGLTSDLPDMTLL